MHAPVFLVRDINQGKRAGTGQGVRGDGQIFSDGAAIISVPYAVPIGAVIDRSRVRVGRFQEEQLRHNPKISRLCPASVKPCSCATWFAHDSTASAEISTAMPQERHTRWWWWVLEHMR